MDILLANPRGFCAGVDRAIEIVKRALDTLGAPIYVRHEVGHNRYVVDDLRHRGAVFVEELDELPDGAPVIFSAPGVAQAVRQEAAGRGLTGFPAIQGPRNDDICYATQNRQDAVRELARQCDLVLVVGSPNSSNSNRLRELAEREGVAAHLIDGAVEIDPRWVEGRRHIGVSAGASAPEVLVRGVIERLHELGATGVRELDGEPEDMVFALPRELRVQLVD